METLDFTGLLFEILPLKNLLDFTNDLDAYDEKVGVCYQLCGTI